MRARGTLAVVVLFVSRLLLAQTSPTLTITTTSPLPSGEVGSPYGITFQATGGQSESGYFWSLNGNLPAGLNFDSGGHISGTPTATGFSQFTVTVRNLQTTASKVFSLQIYAPLVITNNSPLPRGTVGVPYNLTFNATGGLSPYNFSATPVDPFSPGTIPTGMNLNGNTGFLSGTPDTAKTYSFNLLVTDTIGGQATKNFQITIAPALVFVTTSPLPDAGAGVAYSQTITVSGGTPPYSFTTTTAPPGLTLSTAGVLSGTPTQIGTFTVRISVSDSIGVSKAQDYSLKISATPPQLQVSPTSLSFSGFVGGDAPPSQTVIVLSTGTSAATFRVTLDGGSSTAPTAPSWISVKPTSGVTPGRLIVSVNQGSMTSGSYTAARIRVIDAAQNAIDISVSLTLTIATPKLDVVPSLLRFAARAQSPSTLEQVLVLRNSGGGIPLSFSVAVLGRSTWISSITPTSGQTVQSSVVFVRVRVNTQGLQVGAFRDVIRVSTVAGNVDIPVSLFVANNGSIIGLDVAGVRFQARQGGGYATPTNVNILNLGDPSTTVRWTADIVSGSNIVALSPATGTATTTNPGILKLTLSSGATQLSPGGYHALVRVSDSQSLNSPQYVDAVLDLGSSATLAKPDPFPIAVTFTAPATGAPPSQQISVYTSSATAVSFVASASTPDGTTWLSISPSSGTSTGLTPGTFVVSANPAGLPPGIYTGEVDVAMNGFVRTVNATLINPGSGTTAAIDGPTATCTPAQLGLTATGLVNNFAVPAGWPATLIAQMNDNCGSLVSNGSVVASFSNGDSPLTLRGDGQTGTYSATWQPGVVSTQMTVTLRGSASTLQPATAQLIGGIAQNQTPVLARQGTLHNLNPVVGGALAPGTVSQMFGSGLASQQVSPGVIPLVTTFNNTFVVVGGLQAPLYFLSDGQLNIQIPNELPSNQQHAIVVSANGALTIPDLIDVIPVVPGVAAFSDGRLIAQHGDFVLVDSTRPAKPGEFLMMYLAGMGPTNPSVKSGAAAPSAEPLARVTNAPTVTVDGQNSTVFFAGLTPGAAGLYQINFQIPTNARTGDLDVVVTQNGQTANTTRIPVQP